MKKLLPLFLFVFILSAFSQEKESKTAKVYNNDLRKANTYFSRAFYAKAIPLYEKIIKENRTKDIVENLAISYYNVGDLKSSATLYGYLLNRNNKEKTYINTFKYVQGLRASGNYTDANSVMIEYYIENGDSLALKKFNADVKTLENIIAIGNRYELKSLPINTDRSEFGIAAYNDYLVFAASKKEQKKNNLLKGYYGWNNEPFLDLYTIHKDSILLNNAKFKSISSKINTKLHEATAAFSKDNKTMYFTRNNYNDGEEVKDDKRITHLKLYKAKLVDSIWTNVEALPFNGDDYSVEHPALSPDGKRLYFSSDMPGTLGAFDLFYVDIESDSTYSAPVNLGSKINTKHREQFPFIANNGDLYFSSNGHLGFGGLDVFYAPIKGDSFKKPDNLGLPLNSGYDDFAIYLDSTYKSGYVSSNRLGGKGGDDLFSFKELKPLIIEDCKQYIAGIITDKDTKAPILNATVTITRVLEKEKMLLGTYVTEKQGMFNLTSVCDITIVVNVTANGYKDAMRTINIGSERNKKNDASLELVSLASIKKKEEEEQKRSLLKQKELEQQKQKLEQEKLEQEKLNKEKEKEKIIASEPHIKRLRNKLVIETRDINFDYKLWYIRKDVKKVLQRVVQLMRKYPNMQIEIGCHTDIRGNKAYNKELSQKRANSIQTYIVDQGIKENRITAVGYGESNPIKECATDDACNEEEHEINRRAEFVIKQLL